MSAKIGMPFTEISLNTLRSSRTEKFFSSEETVDELETATGLRKWTPQFTHSVANELRFMPNPYYLHSMQPAITAPMRAMLIDWVYEVSAEFGLKRQSVHLAVNILDRFLSVHANVDKDKFQLVGLAALWIAAKYEEYPALQLNDWLKAASYGYTREELKATEQLILSKLQWRVGSTSAFTLLNGLLTEWEAFAASSLSFKQANSTGYKRFRETMQFLDAVMMDAEALQFRPTHLTASIFLLQVKKSMGSERLAESLCAEFFREVFGLDGLDTLTCPLKYLKQFNDLPLSKELPKICKYMPRAQLESHYEEFLCYQTHTLTNFEFVRNKLKHKV